MTNSLFDLTNQMLETALTAGADACDALAIDGTSISINVRNGALEHAERSEGIDIGLRVLVGQKQACVSASDVKTETIVQMAERAVAMAKEAPSDPHVGLAEKSELAQDTDVSQLELFDPSDEPDPKVLQDMAIEAETSALTVEGVTQCQSASAGYGKRNVYLSASNGFSAGYSRTDFGLSCVAICGEGTEMERDYDYDSRVFRNDVRSAKDIGNRAGERAVAGHGAKKPPTGAYPVLFDERISSSLIGHLLQAVNGAAIARGSSWLRDLLGEQILPAGLSVLEDPHRKRVAGSRLFDAEGLATKPRAIVDNGILTGWTLDLANARKLDMSSTANAQRGTGSAPSPGLSNVALTQGTQSKEDLIKDIGTGLLVTSMIGSTINPNTGDYSRGASGFWIENGEISHPVNECTVAGNLKDMLRTIVPANDAQQHLSRVVPSLLVEGLTLAGD